MGDAIPLVKASKPKAKSSSSSAGKAKNTGSHTYLPSPAGLGKPPKEGDVVEFHHPKHKRKHRGRVTAVGEDGYRARISDGSGVDVPHSHHLAVLPSGDFGSEKGLSPQDAKEAFLGPTREGGLPATDLQVAILDVLAQHGFPIDEDSISKIHYDDAQKLISEFVLDDQAGARTRGPADSDMQPGGSEAQDGTDQPPAGAESPPEGGPGDDEGQGQEGQEQGGPGGAEEDGPEGAGGPPPQSGLPEDAEPEGNDTTPTPHMGEAEDEAKQAGQAQDAPDDPGDQEDAAQDGTDQTGQPAQDMGGPVGSQENEDEGINPEALKALRKLIQALAATSESAGKKDKKEKPVTGTNKPPQTR